MKGLDEKIAYSTAEMSELPNERIPDYAGEREGAGDRPGLSDLPSFFPWVVGRSERELKGEALRRGNRPKRGFTSRRNNGGRRRRRRRRRKGLREEADGRGFPGSR